MAAGVERPKLTPPGNPGTFYQTILDHLGRWLPQWRWGNGCDWLKWEPPSCFAFWGGLGSVCCLPLQAGGQWCVLGDGSCARWTDPQNWDTCGNIVPLASGMSVRWLGKGRIRREGSHCICIAQLTGCNTNGERCGKKGLLHRV